jgi:acetyl esterase/lipase
MVHDAKRAILWMKEHAATYGVNADHIVIGGGSAGGHLALLTAYTSDDPGFTPDDTTGEDVSVCGVISLYGTNDLAALYYHTNQDLTTRSVPGGTKKVVPTKMPTWMIRAMGENYHRLGFDKGFENSGALAPLLGGHPDECPERYLLFSPVSHVHPGCPPTLLVQGEHDIMAPVTATHRLYGLLLQNKVPVVMHILPQTDHGFDLVLPKLSPSAHNAIYDVERFMALMALQERKVKSRANIHDYSVAKQAEISSAFVGR